MTEYEGRTVVARLRLELIIVIQRSMERGARREAVRVGRDGICSSCLAHVVDREEMDVRL
jgi:hypothetical protein